ncbi:uncharacterized protein LOC135235191 isoform X1 [Anguilla rostrata]|uniref:uncharacterized protein LOC135235191 isoform X1 n=1 Tax=Anguilla rostrata TaxID=7938 RepID=UPI0030D2B0A9
MMTELEIDQSHLPRVQKVCQCFAVLEDGVLAHSLQEQEIEQHYSSNVQKSQRVQTDLRVAKRLQDEEEREAPLSQATRRLEEQDFEYALMIQDEIQRCAEEARRREREDEEVAKRIQEEEEMGAKHRKLESGCHGNSTAFPLCEEHCSNRHLPPPSVLASTRFIPCPRPLWPPATRGQRPVCGASSESITDPLSPVCGTSRAPRLGARPAAVLGPIRNGPGNSRRSGRGSGRGSGVLWWLTTAAHRPGKWLNSAPCGQLGASGYTQGEGSCCSCRRLREDRAGGGGKERIVGLSRQGPCADLRSAGEGSGGARGGNVCPQDGVCRWTYHANRAAAERRVHFLDEGRRCHSHHGDRKRGSLGCVDSPNSGRCRAVRRGYHGDLTQRAGGVGVDGVTVGSEDPVWHSYRGNTSSGQRGSTGSVQRRWRSGEGPGQEQDEAWGGPGESGRRG